MVKVIVTAVRAKINVFFFIMLLNDSRPTRAGHWVKCRYHRYIAQQYSVFLEFMKTYFIARSAFSTAITVTPTSAKTASHMVATPNAARIRNSSFTPRANAMF